MPPAHPAPAGPAKIEARDTPPSERDLERFQAFAPTKAAWRLAPAGVSLLASISRTPAALARSVPEPRPRLPEAADPRAPASAFRNAWAVRRQSLPAVRQL